MTRKPKCHEIQSFITITDIFVLIFVKFSKFKIYSSFLDYYLFARRLNDVQNTFSALNLQILLFF